MKECAGCSCEFEGGEEYCATCAAENAADGRTEAQSLCAEVRRLQAENTRYWVALRAAGLLRDGKLPPDPAPVYRSSWTCPCGTKCRSNKPEPPADGLCRSCSDPRNVEIAQLRAALEAAKVTLGRFAAMDCDEEIQGGEAAEAMAAIDKALRGES